MFYPPTLSISLSSSTRLVILISTWLKESCLVLPHVAAVEALAHRQPLQLLLG